MSKVLIVEDELSIAELEKDYLELSSFEVEIETDGQQGLEKALKNDFDMIILDIMLPGVDGFEICKQIREAKEIPILMVSARKEDIDKIRVLGLGADDYITKPFNILEVKARIKAILRRSAHHDVKEEESAKVVECRGLKIDCESRRVHIHGKEVNLTAKEFDLLELLVFHPNKVYSREDLLNTVWGYDYPGDARTVDVHIRRLREKIEVNPGVPDYVHTKWGVGYYFQS